MSASVEEQQEAEAALERARENLTAKQAELSAAQSARDDAKAFYQVWFLLVASRILPSFTMCCWRAHRMRKKVEPKSACYMQPRL